MSEPISPPTEGPALVATSYPPLPGVEPVRTHRIHWLFALPVALAAILLPRRLGPHLAASSWTAAYVVHFLSLALFWGTLWAMAWESSQNQILGDDLFSPVLSATEHLRRPFAACVLLGAEAFETWPTVIAALIVAALFELGPWLAAVALIPWYAAGERRRLVYLRCVKLLLWSTACLVPAGYALPALMRYSMWHIASISPEWVLFPFFWACVVWYVSVILRLGGRYGGPKDGPGWEPRALRCEQCDYDMTLLPLAGRCPECGQPVADSLPERRHLPAFAAARGLWARLRAYGQTAWQSFFATRFGRSICVWQGQRAARQFAGVTCVLAGVFSALGAIPHWGALLDDRDRSAAEPTLLYVLLETGAACLGGLFCTAWLFAAGMVVSRCGFRDATARGVMVCYSAAWLLLAQVLGLLGLWAIRAVYENLHVTDELEFPLLGPVEIGVLISIGLLLPMFATLALWFFHLRRLLRVSRYANS